MTTPATGVSERNSSPTAVGDEAAASELQHQGAATRLLDCSRNAFVALWFTCRSEPEKDGSLIGFQLGENAVHLDTAALRHGIDELLTMASGRLLWWQPRSLSPRISAQQAAFVFGQVIDEPWGSIRLGGGGVGLDEIGVVPGAAVIFVSAQLKTVLNGIWEPMLGFSEESLFPDLAGFALAHSVDKPFPADPTTNTPNS